MENLSAWIVIRRLRIPFLIIILTFSISILGMMLIPGMDDHGNVYHLNFFDAFYFVSYMASTIGFGESPYAFTYPQKLWVSFSIYLTVIGWFYGIGTIVALIQDEMLHKEIAKSRFYNAVREMEEPFILIFGYNNVTKALIRKLNLIQTRMVVIDKDQHAIDALNLEHYHPAIPAISGDVLDPKTLEMAGIRYRECQAAVILFENDKKNTKLAMMCRHLNKKMKLIVRSSTMQNSEFLYNIGVEHIENPFNVISSRLYLALTAPHLWVLEMWVHGHLLKIKKREILPKGRYVIYGYGRMGKALEKGLGKAGVAYTFIDARLPGSRNGELGELVGEDEIEAKLLEADIATASVIIAGTRDDIVNLAVIALAKKHNPDIYTISRENELADLQVFKAARIDRNYILEEIIINKTYNYLARPLANIFIKHLNTKTEEWGEALVRRIVEKMGENPSLTEMEISPHQAFAVCNELEKGTKITLEMLKRRREDYTRQNDLLFLMIVREGESILLPPDDFEIAPGDEMLVVCNQESETDLAYILNNYYELYYVMTGREKITGILKYFVRQNATS
ncbi:MAG: portal protein [Campylobacteraceae bacterium 4484_4]|nr:MAG: portal protein [Campylobacteraceae bacterium 4484_4]